MGLAGALVCLFPARLYKWIKFSLHFTNAGSCIVGLRRNLARGFSTKLYVVRAVA